MWRLSLKPVFAVVSQEHLQFMYRAHSALHVAIGVLPFSSFAATVTANAARHLASCATAAKHWAKLHIR